MKRTLHAFAMCQSMFCAIPSPWQGWDEKAREQMLLYLPVVGLEIGALWALLGWLCLYLQLPGTVTALVMCAFPYLITGFIHLDGYMDVTDAVKSWRDLERRREILKDSHVGSFSVIAVVLLMLAQFALFAAMPPQAPVWVLITVPVFSRCCSALAVTVLPPMSTSQYAGKVKKPSHIVILLCMMAVCALCAGIFWGRYALVLLGCGAGFALALLRAYRSLEGMNGDISGYCLTFSELAAVAVFVLI